MTVISIVGPPGVGKSTLVRQLACLNCAPAFFEGEEGIFRRSVLDVLNSPYDSKERYKWILDRFRRTLLKAHRISQQGVDVYVDGDILTFEAWLNAETGAHSKAILKKWLKLNKDLRAHMMVVLTASTQKIEENIRKRGRTSEQNPFLLDRARRVHSEFLKMSDKYIHILLLDRTDINFTDEDHLLDVDKIIKEFQKKVV